ncbi:hypothetical protein [Shewanella gelidii]|uniref:Uncharacterized protein n=1 Tax=Shewanella gelidii TaxID=1642821 RepID=A0A917JSI1_9GAMM|nr:hypothetical protein [Shewanella gelidii]MCL1098196.1 hypothetical protein [Shewanella gelidii]GGI83296.1 hypothetical protein GCM10009332_20750 [Shewanella gelidii]
MMWNWLLNKIGKKPVQQRKKVQIDIPYEQHQYRVEDMNVGKLTKNVSNVKEDAQDS